MVRITKDNKVYIKILIWGISESGKTSFIDILYRMAKEERIDLTPIGNLAKIAMASGATLYYDRGVFESKKREDTIYHVYSVAGKPRFVPLRKKVFKGTDGVILTVDARKKYLSKNIESLQELIKITEQDLIKKIPLIVLLNKRDSDDCINKQDFEDILKAENLWYNSKHELYSWNPIIYEFSITFEQKNDIYNCFKECARRAGIYILFGKGFAPVSDDYKKKLADLDKEVFAKSILKSISPDIKSDNDNIIDLIKQTMQISEDYLQLAWELLNKAQMALSSENFEEAIKYCSESKEIFIELGSEQGIKKIEELLKDIDTKTKKIDQILSNNKRLIHNIMYNGSLKRCLLHDELDTKCTKLKEIKKTIESSKINGFFMYQFPKKEEDLEYDFLKMDNEEYKREIQKIKNLIQDVNQDPNLNIDFPTEVTSLSIKTCDFCRIARSYDFGILLLNPPNPNAFLEAGMFLSLSKKLVLLNNESRLKEAPYDLSPYVYIKYDTLEELEDSWNNYMVKFLETIKNNYKVFTRIDG